MARRPATPSARGAVVAEQERPAAPPAGTPETGPVAGPRRRASARRPEAAEGGDPGPASKAPARRPGAPGERPAPMDRSGPVHPLASPPPFGTGAAPRTDRPNGDGDRAPRDGEDARPGPAVRRAVGRPSVVRDAAAAFAARLAGLPPGADPAEIERLWTEEMAGHADKAPRTLKRITSEHYRPAVLRALGAGHPALVPALAIVKPPAELSDAIRRDDIARVAASHRQQVAVPRWREIVARATGLLASGAALDLVAGLLLVTGRRPYEVCCTGRFAPAPLPGGAPRARSRWSVLFDGQAKTKNRPGTRAGIAYEIPVLAEARAVIAALDALRASPEGRRWAGMTNEAFRATTLRLALTEAVVRAYGELWPSRSDPSPEGRQLGQNCVLPIRRASPRGDRLEPRALRPLYAEIAHKRFGDAGVTKNSFFAAVLGHTMNDLHTSLSYMDYHLADEDGAGARQAATGVADRLLRQVRAVGLDPDRVSGPGGFRSTSAPRGPTRG